jgi:hypothetical protein
MMNKATMMDMAPELTKLPKPPMAPGNPAAMPAKIKIEMPLPKPRSVICSPSHIKNIVPATKLVTAVKRKPQPGAITKPGELSSATAMLNDWNNAKPKVP